MGEGSGGRTIVRWVRIDHRLEGFSSSARCQTQNRQRNETASTDRAADFPFLFLRVGSFNRHDWCFVQCAILLDRVGVVLAESFSSASTAGVGSVRFGSVRLGLVRLGSVRLGKFPPNCIISVGLAFRGYRDGVSMGCNGG